MLDTEGRIASWNPGAARIKGYDAADATRTVKIRYTVKNALRFFEEHLRAPRPE